MGALQQRIDLYDGRAGRIQSLRHARPLQVRRLAHDHRQIEARNIAEQFFVRQKRIQRHKAAVGR